MFRKAQAAMEFLMTYGWAIMVVLVVIGALAYFGVLSPGTLVPEKCTLPMLLSCNNFKVGGATAVPANTITIQVQNGAGRGISINSVSFSGDALAAACTTNYAPVKAIANGASDSLACSPPAGILSTGRDKNRYKITIAYAWSDSPTFSHTLEGELFARTE